MSTLHILILGIILGAGLHAATRSVLKTLQLRRLRKDHAVELEIQRRVKERTGGWGLASEGYVPQSRPAGPGPANW